MRRSFYKNITLSLFLFLVLFLNSTSVSAFLVNQTSSGLDIKWANNDVSYFINPAGGPSGSIASLQAGMNVWTNVPSSSFRFFYSGTTTSNAYGISDDENIIVFGSLGASGIGALGRNSFWYAPSTGEIVDSDIIFNTDFTFVTDGSFSGYDIQSVGAHELGHSLSLADLYSEADSEKTMFGSTSNGEIKKRSLHADDIAGITYLYPHLSNDVLMDFGSTNGMWAKYNNSTWTMLHGLSPTLIAVGDLDGTGKDEAIAVFAGYGVYARYDDAGDWLFLHSLVPSQIITANLDGDAAGKDEVIAVFPGFGTYIRYNNIGAWVQLMGLEPQGIVIGDLDGNGKDELIGDFGDPATGGFGVWGWYNDTNWQQIANADAGVMATGELDGQGQDEFIAYFPAFGAIWIKYNNAGWGFLLEVVPESIITGNLDDDAAGKDEVIVDFGIYGIWAKYNDTTWTMLLGVNPELLATGDLDGSSKMDLVVDFGAEWGTWVKMNDGEFTLFHTFSAEGMATGNLDGN